MNFFFEVLIGGLLSGVMYALVAIGFVLIYKASGVFNFAQGAMVLFAALTFVSLLAAGAVLGQNGLFVPHMELLVAASVLALGVMLTLPFNPGLTAALAVIGGFALGAWGPGGGAAGMRDVAIGIGPGRGRHLGRDHDRGHVLGLEHGAVDLDAHAKIGRAHV